MTSLRTSSENTAGPIPLRCRQDLLFQAQEIGGLTYWCVKDPISLEYFHLKNEEFAILKMLDGKLGAADVLQKFRQMFAPLRISAAQLGRFLEMLLLNGLVVSDFPHADPLLRAQMQATGRREKLRWLTSILAIRLRGVDPDRFLSWLYGQVSWMFHPVFAVLSILLMLGAAGIAAVRFDEISNELPQLEAFLTADNLAVLALGLVVLKILHEIAHGLACKHYGGECHELGLLLLVFTPCLYCDVSDMWMEPSKWKRIAVSAAGIACELFIAAICTILWSLSQPGLLHTISLNVMLIASVNTLLFNGNILRRYDGYYIFSDLIEVPNLSDRARRVRNQVLAKYFLGIPVDAGQPREEKATLLLGYSIASSVYFCVLTVAILWFCRAVLKPHGLAPLADLIALMTIIAAIVPAVVGTVRTIRTARRNGVRFEKGRPTFALGLLAVALTVFLAVPLPFHVEGTAFLQPRNADNVYVTVGGRLLEGVKPGTVVEANQVLAVLQNQDLDMEIQRLEGEMAETRAQLASLDARKLDDRSVAKDVPATKEFLNELVQQLAQRKRDQDKLTLRAPRAGTVLPPPYRPQTQHQTEALATWSGYPLEEANRGCYLESGTVVCLIGSENDLESIVLVDESQISYVKVDQDVRLQFEERPAQIFHGTVAEVSADNLTIAPKELAFGKKLAIRSDESGQKHLLENSYQVRTQLTDATADLLKMRTTGRAKISAPNQILAARLYRYLRRTFHTKW